MLQIEYYTSNSLKELKALDASQLDLRYNLFLGSIILKFKTSKINLDWGWIPLLDFTYSLMIICSNLLLEENSMEKFDFTESDGVLVFQRKEDLIEITTSFSDENILLDIDSFKQGVYSCYSKLVSQIKNGNKKLIDNPNFQIYENQLNSIHM